MYFKEIYDISKNNKYIPDQIRVLSNIAFIYYLMQDYEEALYFLKKAIEISTINNYTKDIFYAYIVMANVYIKLNEYNKVNVN